jgi:hypothetical protein
VTRDEGTGSVEGRVSRERYGFRFQCSGSEAVTETRNLTPETRHRES